MPRPLKKRRVGCCTHYRMFGPNKTDNDDVLILTRDAFEAFKLIDYDALTQEQAATAMGVARTTVQRLYKQARQTIAKAFVEGNYIHISHHHPHIKEKGECQMTIDQTKKVLIALKDEQVVSCMHEAETFYLVSIEKGEVIRKDIVESKSDKKIGCRRFVISLGADVLCVGGMSKHNYPKYVEAGITVLKAEGKKETVLKEYLDNNLPSMNDYAHDENDHNCEGHHGQKHHHHGECCHTHTHE